MGEFGREEGADVAFGDGALSGDLVLVLWVWGCGGEGGCVCECSNIVGRKGKDREMKKQQYTSEESVACDGQSDGETAS